MQAADPIDGIRIASPCTASWERMTGDARMRHCTACELNVYNFAEMSREEIRELLMKSEGRVCARLYRRADGTLLTRDCPSALKAVRRRVSRFASAMVAAALSLASLTTGCATGFARNRSKIEIAIEQAASPRQAIFTGVVVDETSGPLPGVEVVVRDEASVLERSVFTDANGQFVIGPLPDGLYRVEAKLDGFSPALVEHVAVKENEIARAQVTLRMDLSEDVVVGAVVYEPESIPGATVLTEDFLRKLPF